MDELGAALDRAAVYRQVAALHTANLDQGFLSTLGTGFLALMYRAIDEAPGSVLIWEEDAGRVVGFVSGGRGMGAIYRMMLRRPVALAVALLPSMFSVRRVHRILEILLYSRKTTTGPALPDAELLSIAVDLNYRGGSVAKRLYQRLVAHFAAQGVAAFKITVGDALAPAHRFYLRMGARPTAVIEVHRGTSSTVYVHENPQGPR